MSYQINKNHLPKSNDSVKITPYNPGSIKVNKDNPLDIDIDNEDNIFTFICSSKNNKENNKFLELIYQIEYRVKGIVMKKELENISKNYPNISFEINWIDVEYKKLIIKQISEDLITDNILAIFKK